MVLVEILRSGVRTFDTAAGKHDGAPNAIKKLRVRGHAGYAACGEDIVCAAASATVYTAAGALFELCGAPRSCARERDGFFEISVPEFHDEDSFYRADIIMETACIGFRQIEASYPDFLKVTEKG